MKVIIPVICPKCGLENLTESETKFVPPTIIFCDEEIGGCGVAFAYTAHVTVLLDTTVYQLVGVEEEVDAPHELLDGLRAYSMLVGWCCK